jgi:DNA polymerase-3 subunit alpha
MMPGKMEFSPILNEDEALIRKAVRPEEFDKKELIALAGEDDLEERLSKLKCWRGI